MKKFRIDEEAQCIEFFDEHHYPLPGKDIAVPSVTKKIGDVYRKGVQFEQWLRDTGNESKVISKEAAAKGNIIHNAIEKAIDKGEIIDPLSELGESIVFEKMEWIKFVKWGEWYLDLFRDNRLKPFAVEAVVYGETIAGKIDFLGWVDGVFSIMDWKSGKGIHDESYIQQAAYMKLWNDTAVARKVPKVEKAYLVHIGSKHKGKSKGKLHNAKIGVYEIDYVKHPRLFEIALEAWALMNPNYQVPGQSFPLKVDVREASLAVDKVKEKETANVPN